MTKKTYCLTLLLPALFYYVALDLWPQTLSSLLFGWPLSVLLGLGVMLWAVVVGLVFARRSVANGAVVGGEHE